MIASRKNLFPIIGVLLSASIFLAMGLNPKTLRTDPSIQSIEQLAQVGIIHEFVDLAERFPEHFHRDFPEGVTYATFGEALKLGQQIYIAEGCWHCHTQQIRRDTQDVLRWGPESQTLEYQNILHTPALKGMRRVGPDLIREAAKRSTDWHIAHFYMPRAVSPTSVMPEYNWFFNEKGYPNKKGFAIITYLQWLGSMHDDYPDIH